MNPHRKIVIVDDEPNVLNALRRALRREPYEITVFSNPVEALEHMRTYDVDLVISDHLMPQMTGLELLKVLRTRKPDTMRLMLTGHADMQTAIHAINHGEIFRFITKPWDDTELKVILFLAFEQLDLQREHRRLLSFMRRHQAALEPLMRKFGEDVPMTTDPDDAIIVEQPGLRPPDLN